MSNGSRFLWLTVAAVVLRGPVQAAPPEAAVDFARDIQPIHAGNCLKCHGPDRHKAGLRLDSARAARQGGDSGPALLPGKGSASLLVRRVTGQGDGPAMPPGGKRLTMAEIDRLRAWIDQGAPWPETPGPGRGRPAHWSFRPIRKPAVPAVRQAGWARDPLDRFVQARFEHEGIASASEADRTTLLRRLYLDLVGLPPPLDEIDAFPGDHRPDAYERLVDRLLASPHFGERWGQHWLDLARYADSDGYENDRPRSKAWLWRDWVVAAFNRDLAFDRFTLEQIAGDLLPGAGSEQKLATGFHLNSLSNSAGGADREEFRVKAVKDRLEAVGLGWLGLTVGCAQCHSHKYDPITHREYYQLYAFFNDAGDGSLALPGKLKAAVLTSQPRTTRIHLRGDFLKPGDEVQPDTPAFLPPLGPRGPRADRLDLARWLVAPAHPLTARVAANHVWQHLFGKGLVPTPDNFGIKGEPPVHPELLDYLAAELRDGGWSRKALIRRIVCSATYRQSSRPRPELEERDPGNALLARQNRFAVPAEVVRDLALAAGGLLRPSLGGPGVQPPLPRGLTVLHELKNERFLEETKGEARYRRGLYIHRQRTLPYPTLQTFDGPDGNAPCLVRDTSTTPMQALTLLNDPAFHECAQALARRALALPAGDTRSRLERAFQLALARRPDAAETDVLAGLLDERRASLISEGARAASLIGSAKLPARSDVAEAAAWLSVARALLNLEEFITRE